MPVFTLWFAAVIPCDAAMWQSVDFERGKCEYAVLSLCSELLSICCATEQIQRCEITLATLQPIMRLSMVTV